MDLEPQYQKARAFPQFRQQFLESIDLGEYKKYIHRVRYIAPKTFFDSVVESTGGMACVSINPLQAVFGLKGIKASVLVNQNSFLRIENPYDFLGYLLHHEGEHARQKFEEGFEPLWFSIRWKRPHERQEAFAWANQLRNLDSQKNSRQYQEQVYEQFLARAKFL